MTITNNINNANEFKNNLGLKQLHEGTSDPRCGRQLKERGRKSLVELRAKTGKKEDQRKINEILKIRKGKIFPIE